MKGKQFITTYFFIVSVLGALYLLAEAGLQLSGRSICVSGGCGLAAQFARFGELSVILTGFIALAFLALSSGLNRRKRSERLDLAINLALIAALAAEGFFVGYQVFWLAEVCLLCLSVFGIFIALGLLRLLAGWREAAVGFAAFAVVLGCVGFVLPPPGKALPADKKMVLFYSTECKYCSEVKEEIDQKKLDITPVLVKEYSATLRSMGVNSVPTIFVNGRSEKLFITGKEAILRYLAACQASGATPAVSGAPAPKKGSGSISGDAGAVFPLPSLGAPSSIFDSSSEEGVCKEEQKCD